jgi:hypothetical protein
MLRVAAALIILGGGCYPAPIWVASNIDFAATIRLGSMDSGFSVSEDTTGAPIVISDYSKDNMIDLFDQATVVSSDLDKFESLLLEALNHSNQLAPLAFRN